LSAFEPSCIVPRRLVTFPFPAACLALCAGFRLRKAESFSIQVAGCFIPIMPIVRGIAAVMFPGPRSFR